MRYVHAMTAISSIHAGLQTGLRAFERASERLVLAQAKPAGDPEPTQLLSEFLAARLQVRASAQAARVSSDTLASLIDILA